MKVIAAVVIAISLTSCTPEQIAIYSQFVWDTVEVEGKPDSPPQLAASRQLCVGSGAHSCYDPIHHEMWIEPQPIEGSTIYVIDHELTHGLLRNDPVQAACAAEAVSKEARQACSHDERFDEVEAQVNALFHDWKWAKWKREANAYYS